MAATCRASVGCLRRQGGHLQIGLTTSAEQGEAALPTDLLVLEEASVVGSSGMPAPRFGALLAMVESGTLQPGRLVNRRIPLPDPPGGGGPRARRHGHLRHRRRHRRRPVLSSAGRSSGR